ncbi:response regulator [Synoicihabitans lomoniglobus]|uniref:Response regulator transcription factor n=1 Tax=Synoicihabitans lomoniglobus TaxID=2909285 RepID=A0AAF0CGD2_9BACT|nr:response regulator transcription factor [Opitutaceae bacterium LMO-M01]WED63452.1 response regulator transcription factor [Opitutaceae bacterium LMO-M01]
MPRSDSSPRILVADDHVLIREAIPNTIRQHLPGATFALVGDATATLKAVTTSSWDLVVLDLGLPGSCEMDTVRALRERCPALPILVFTMFPESKMGAAAIEAGASGYLCKTADLAALVQATITLLEGRRYHSEKLGRQLAQRSTARRGNLSALSPREVEVLTQLGAGLSNKEIAAQLDLAVSSVGTYRARLLEKLQLRTTADLLRFVVEHGLHDR